MSTMSTMSMTRWFFFAILTAMAIFTLAEIEAQMAAYKQALLAVAEGKSFRMSTGGSDRTWTSEDTPEIRKTLEWLDSERTKLSVGSGPQILVGRPKR